LRLRHAAERRERGDDDGLRRFPAWATLVQIVVLAGAASIVLLAVWATMRESRRKALPTTARPKERF